MDNKDTAKFRAELNHNSNTVILELQFAAFCYNNYL